MKKKLFILTLSLLLILALAACADTDVVGTESVNSFEKVLEAMENNVAEDEMKGGWALTSTDGSERFIWSHLSMQASMLPNYPQGY